MRKQKQLTSSEVVARLKQMQGERSLREFAGAIRVSAPYLSDVYLGRRAVGPKLCKLLGISKTREFITTYSEIKEKSA